MLAVFSAECYFLLLLWWCSAECQDAECGRDSGQYYKTFDGCNYITIGMTLSKSQRNVPKVS